MLRLELSDFLTDFRSLATLGQVILIYVNGQHSFPMGADALAETEMRLARLTVFAKKFNLSASEASIKRLGLQFTRFERDNSGVIAIKDNNAAILVKYLESMTNILRDDLSSKFVFIIAPKYAELLDSELPVFGGQVHDAFPSAEADIRDAARCLSVGANTACVIHCMRALEPALHKLQESVGVNVQKEQWDQIIRQIESKIREINKRTHGADDEQWFAEAASHFLHIKNAWRNYAAHGRAHYDEEKASEVFYSTKALMRHLATRLSE